MRIMGCWCSRNRLQSSTKRGKGRAICSSGWFARSRGAGTSLCAFARRHQAIRTQLNAPKQEKNPRPAHEIPIGQPFGIL